MVAPRRLLEEIRKLYRPLHHLPSVTRRRFVVVIRIVIEIWQTVVLLRGQDETFEIIAGTAHHLLQEEISEEEMPRLMVPVISTMGRLAEILGAIIKDLFLLPLSERMEEIFATTQDLEIFDPNQVHQNHQVGEWTVQTDTLEVPQIS